MLTGMSTFLMAPKPGLVLAEIGLTDGHQQLELPAWLGDEVTGKAQYYNSNLTYEPVCEWPKSP